MWFSTRVETVLRLFGPWISISDYVLLSITQGVDSVSTLGEIDWLLLIGSVLELGDHGSTSSSD